MCCDAIFHQNEELKFQVIEAEGQRVAAEIEKFVLEMEL
jgi:hypothetical protein